jgi:hypothetical protein
LGNVTTLASLCRQVEKLTQLTLSAPARCVKALLAMRPPLLLPPSFGKEDDTCSTHTNSSSTTSAHAICRVLKAHALLVWPLPASPVGGKDGKGDSDNNDGNAGSGGQELDCATDWDGPPFHSSSLLVAVQWQQGWQVSEG